MYTHVKEFLSNKHFETFSGVCYARKTLLTNGCQYENRRCSYTSSSSVVVWKLKMPFLYYWTQEMSTWRKGKQAGSASLSRKKGLLSTTILSKWDDNKEMPKRAILYREEEEEEERWRREEVSFVFSEWKCILFLLKFHIPNNNSITTTLSPHYYCPLATLLSPEKVGRKEKVVKSILRTSQHSLSRTDFKYPL